MRATRYLSGFEEDLDAAVEFYLGERTELARRFVTAVEQALAALEAFPDSGAPAAGDPELDLRQAPVRKFPYHLIYSNRESGIVLVACAHRSRRPGYWRHRVE